MRQKSRLNFLVVKKAISKDFKELCSRLENYSPLASYMDRRLDHLGDLPRALSAA